MGKPIIYTDEVIEQLKIKRDKFLAKEKTCKFADPVSDDKIDDLSCKKYAKYSERNYLWVVGMYQTSRRQCNELVHLHKIKVDLYDPETFTKEDMSCELCRFISETKKESGAEFPPKTIQHLILAIQMYLFSLGYCWHLLDDPEFSSLKFCVDNVMKQKASMGLGSEVKQVEALSVDQIDKLWNSGYLGEDEPKLLSKTILFLLGLNCALRAGKEHKALRRPGFNSQFKFGAASGQECLQYVEDFSTKCNKGGLKHQGITGKKVIIYPAEDVTRCPVSCTRSILVCSLLVVNVLNYICRLILGSKFNLLACGTKTVQ